MAILRSPDFFIVGAPKCGTTAMYSYLRQHPEIFMPEVKEPHFFGTDLYSPHFIRNEAKYLSLFSGARGDQRLGDASVWYLYSERAAAEIKEFNPSARVIIMLRNPVDMVYALHSQRLFTGNEEIEDFEAALEAEVDRRRGRRVPRHSYPVEGLFYHAVAKYSRQVERYLDVFGPEKVRIVIFEDFTGGVAEAYRGVCEFLEVDPRFEPEFGVVNPNKRVRSKSLRGLLDRPPQVASSVYRLLTPLPLREKVRTGLKRFNTKYERRPPLPTEVRRRLQAEFAADVERLGRITGLDFTRWLS